MKKHDHPEKDPAGRSSRSGQGTSGGRSADGHTGTGSSSRGGLSVAGYRDRAPLTVDRSSGLSPHGRRPRGRKPGGRMAILAVGLVLLITVAVVIAPFAGSLLSGKTSGTTRGATAATTAATTASGTAAASGTQNTTGTSAAAATETAASSATTAASASASTMTPAARAQAFAAAKSEFESLVKGYTGRYALYYQNLATGETYTYNASAPFVAASSIKLGINTYLYTQIEAGKVSPTETLAYDSRPYPTGDYEAGTGTIQGQPNGTKYSVRDTSGLSIRISDNCATNMVLRRLGGIDTVNGYLSGISAVVDYRKTVTYKNYAGTTVSGRHRSSATDLGLHAVRLYELYRKSPALYGTLVDDLKKTEFDFGIQKGIPSSVGVAHKIGTNGTYNAENDVGIVFTPEPFVLAVMTESGSAATAHQFQAKAATIFYSYIDKVT